MEKVRGNLYELMTHGIPSDVIFKNLLRELLKNCDLQLKSEIIDCASRYEHRMQQGGKQIYHFEAFIATFMCTYKKFLEDAMSGAF